MTIKSKFLLWLSVSVCLIKYEIKINGWYYYIFIILIIGSEFELYVLDISKIIMFVWQDFKIENNNECYQKIKIYIKYYENEH